jgi:putative membrane protein
MFYMHNFGWGWWLVMSLGMVAFWGLIIYAVVWLLRGGSSQRPEAMGQQRPDEILKQRLAQGELSVDEYERLIATIHQAPREPASMSVRGLGDGCHDADGGRHRW